MRFFSASVSGKTNRADAPEGLLLFGGEHGTQLTKGPLGTECVSSSV